MSRSVKKNAVCPDRNPWAKKQANRRVRRIDIASGCAYKRAYESWNICDWRWSESLTEMWKTQVERNEKCHLGIYGDPKTYMQVRNEWMKMYVRK